MMADLSNIVARARQAQATWAAQPVKGRLRILRCFRHALAIHADRLVAAIESSRPREPGETLSAEILPLAEAIRFLEKRAPGILAPRHKSSSLTPLWLARIALEIRREARGVILIIGPSNYPLMLPGIQAMQALAAGNAVLIKPGFGGAPCLAIFSQLLAAAGLNPDLCQILPEAPECAQQAIAIGVDKVILTGSAVTGEKVLRQLVPNLTPSVMELSGCDAVFVMPDADTDLVVRALVFGMRLNLSATCIAPRRVFVADRLAEALKPKLVEAFNMLPACCVPSAWAAHARTLVKEAVAQGAQILAGDLEEKESFAPILLGSVDPEMAVVNEDITAPVLSLFTTSCHEEALALAARCPYALGATVFGTEPKASQLARRVRSGTVVINDMIAPTADPRLPFGGLGRSGFGLTRGEEGLLEMTSVKTICVRYGSWRPHFDAPSPVTNNLIRAYLTASHGANLRQRLKALKGFFRALMAMRSRRGDGKSIRRDDDA